jgi:aspartyl aminopeptidase
VSSSLKQNLIDTFNHSPSSRHAVNRACARFLRAGFQELIFNEPWAIQPQKRYFSRIANGALLAFVASKKASRLALLGCHTDSPSLKLKQRGLVREEGFWIAHVEPYGNPILASCFYKDLGICAQLLVQGAEGPIEKWIILEEPIGILLSASIHLDRDINQKGFAPDKQKHLKVLIATESSNEQHPLLSKLESLAQGPLLNFEIDFFVLEKAQTLHFDQNLLASWRIDNLASCEACVESMIGVQEPSTFSMALFANHEEIGSNTYSGAQSSRYLHLVHKALEATGFNSDERFSMIHKGLLCSIDNAHGFHPCYSELYEPHHKPLLGSGPVIKFHSGGKYATDASTSSIIQWIANRNKIPLQHFYMRSDLMCGSTIGPILSSLLGIPAIDIGVAQLAMHASRELLHLKDYQNLVSLLTHVLKELPSLQEDQS